MRNSKSDIQGVKLSTLCLEVAWDRPNSGVLCIQSLGHEGNHISNMESFGGKGDQNLHDAPFLIPHFQYLLDGCVDDITKPVTPVVNKTFLTQHKYPNGEDIQDGDLVRVIDFKDPSYAMQGEVTDAGRFSDTTVRVRLMDGQTRFEPGQIEKLA